VGRKASGREQRLPISRLQLVGGDAESAHEESIGLIELLADPLTEGVEARGGRLLGLVRLGLGILAEDGLGAERRASGSHEAQTLYLENSEESEERGLGERREPDAGCACHLCGLGWLAERPLAHLLL